MRRSNTVTKDERRLLGVRALSEYLAHAKRSKADVARDTEACPTRVDRVTVSNLASGGCQRVTIGVARAIEHATHGKVPAEFWDTDDDGRTFSFDEPANDDGGAK